jgi:thiol:disulfide interchange protein
MEFPTPHRQKTGDLVNYGYENAVMSIATITPPAVFNDQHEITLQGKASWLVCKEICIPESANFELKLPVRNDPAPSAWASAFTAARATMPQTHTSNQAAEHDVSTITITIDPLPLPADQMPEEAYFFPHDGLLVVHNGEQKMLLDGRKITLTMPRAPTRSAAITRVSGDLWLRTMTGEQSFHFDAPVVDKTVVQIIAPAKEQGQTVTIAPAPAPVAPQMEMSLMAALLSAFLGGILLNLMPCVFPVLSLKALSLVHKAYHEDRSKVILSGVFYTLGVLASFALLAFVLITLKSTGQHIGWGIQLQSPLFVASMALLLFAIGYVLSGAVTLGGNLIGIGQNLAHKSGHVGSFFTGALAVIVATPCTAPFMGGAVFYGLTQSPAVTFIVLLALGFGLALPYLFLTICPGALRFLPRPGIWMEHFKQFLAFPMIAASIWLVWVLAQQTGSIGVLLSLFSMLSLSFALWLYGTTQNRPRSLWQMIKLLLVLLTLGMTVLLVTKQPREVVQTNISTTAEYEPYSAARLAELRATNQPVFVNMTAAWCISCLANEKATLSTDSVKGFFRDNRITYLKGDWTNYDDAITQYLKEFGRSGVPIYVFYPADQTKPPVVLPQVLTPSLVKDTIQPNL